MMPNLGESGQEIVARLKRDLLPTLKNGVLFWPICDFVTFKFVSVNLQVCFCNFIVFEITALVLDIHKKKKRKLLLLDFAQSYLANIFFFFLIYDCSHW